MDSATNKFRTLRLCLTNDCSLGCFYCSSEGHKGKYSIFNKDNAIRLITAAYSCLGIKRVKYTGGEPFLFGDLADTIKTIRNTHSENIFQSVVTNGTFPEKLKELLDSDNLLEITLSVPCLDQEIFTKLNRRGSDHFTKIMESLQLLCSKGKSFKVNYVLIQGINDTEHQIQSIINIAQENQNCYLRFLEPVKNGENKLKDKYLIDSNLFFNKLKDRFGFDVSSEQRSHSILMSNRANIKYIRFFCKPNCIECPTDKTSVWITPEGTMRRCCYGNMNAKENKITEWDFPSIVKAMNTFAKNNK